MTEKQKPEGLERSSHTGIWEKSVPGRLAIAKIQRVEQNLCVQGTARGLVELEHSEQGESCKKQVARGEMTVTFGSW